MKRTLIILAATASVAATPAASQDSSGQPRERVSYAGLDLASEFGRAALEQRIHAAASRVCDVDFRRESLAEESAVRLCYNRSVADGNRQMSELLTERRSGAASAASTLIISALPDGR